MPAIANVQAEKLAKTALVPLHVVTESATTRPVRPAPPVPKIAAAKTSSCVTKANAPVARIVRGKAVVTMAAVVHVVLVWAGLAASKDNVYATTLAKRANRTVWIARQPRDVSWTTTAVV